MSRGTGGEVGGRWEEGEGEWVGDGPYPRGGLTGGTDKEGLRREWDFREARE